MQAIVNKEDCISCGLCVSLCPDVFRFDDDEKAEAFVDEIPDEFADDAAEARDGCPVSVIDIEV